MRRALVVGIDDYSFGPLRGCVNDAHRMERILTHHDDGAPNFTCKRLTAPHDHITRSLLRESVEALFKQPADAGLFYFSGHGTANNLDGYLVTQDAQKYDDGVSMSEVFQQANAAPIDEVVLIIDSCFSGRLGNPPTVRNDTAVLREGVSILTASRTAEVSVEVNGSGLFTSLVCDALTGGAADVLGRVTAPSMYAYVDQALGAWDQRPLFKSHVSRLLTLRQCDPSIAHTTLRKLPQYFADPMMDYPLDPSYEPDADPRHPEHEAIFGDLQKFRAARLLAPVDEDHLYFAAMRSKACRLTPTGRFYWHLANGGKL